MAQQISAGLPRLLQQPRAAGAGDASDAGDAEPGGRRAKAEPGTPGREALEAVLGGSARSDGDRARGGRPKGDVGSFKPRVPRAASRSFRS